MAHEARLDLDGYKFVPSGGECRRQLAGTGANFDHDATSGHLDRIDDVGEDAGVAQKVLAQRFARPGAG